MSSTNDITSFACRKPTATNTIVTSQMANSVSHGVSMWGVDVMYMMLLFSRQITCNTDHIPLSTVTTFDDTSQAETIAVLLLYKSVMVKITETKLQQHQSIRLLHGGAEYFRHIEKMIASAKHLIHLQVYIFDYDYTGRRIVQLLIAAAARSVKVFVMVDGYASQHLPRAIVKKLRSAGIRLHFFQPLLRSRHFYFGRRMHHKVLVVDGRQAVIGGINIADRYNDVESPAWLDYGVFLSGEPAAELNTVCFEMWKNEGLAEAEKWIKNGNHYVVSPANTDGVAIKRNDWVGRKNQVWRSYNNIFAKSKKSLVIMCSYFLPGIVLRRQLAKAAARGVDVRLVLAGPSDVALAKHAERYLYPWLLRHGIRIFEYQPTVLHAKVAVADRSIATIGSFNVNNISAYASIELNVEIKDRHFANKLQSEIHSIITHQCVEITSEQFESNNTLFRKFVQWISYQIIRVVLNLSTFYFKQE